MLKNNWKTSKWNFFAIIGVIVLIVGGLVMCAVLAFLDEKETKYSRTFQDLKIGSKWHIKSVNDPFNVSDKQIAIVLDKDKSASDGKCYVLFICDRIEFSCEWNNFKKSWVQISKSSPLNKIEIDTDNVSQNYKRFRDEYERQIAEKSNNIFRWE